MVRRCARGAEAIWFTAIASLRDGNTINAFTSLFMIAEMEFVILVIDGAYGR
jgi:hypothetical protein